MKVDGRLEVILIAEAVGHFLDGLNLGVQALTHGIGDPVPEVGNGIGPMARDHPGHLLPKVDLHTPIIGEIDLDLRSLDEMGRMTEVKILVEVIGGPGEAS